MEALKTVIWIVNIFSSLAIIALVLMQHGRGADAGASFGGSGSAQGVFGSGGNANFLSRMTGIAATVFFASCLLLGYIHSQQGSKGLDFGTVQQSSAAPAAKPADEQIAVHEAVSAPAAAYIAAASEEAKAASAASNDSSGSSAMAAAAVGAATGAVAAKMTESKKTETEKNKNESKKASAGKNKKPAKSDAEKSKKKSSSRNKQ